MSFKFKLTPEIEQALILVFKSWTTGAPYSAISLTPEVLITIDGVSLTLYPATKLNPATKHYSLHLGTRVPKDRIFKISWAEGDDRVWFKSVTPKSWDDPRLEGLYCGLLSYIYSNEECA